MLRANDRSDDRAADCRKGCRRVGEHQQPDTLLTVVGAEAARRAVKVAGDRALDRYLGIESAATVSYESLGFGPSRGDLPYVATNWIALLWLRRTLQRFGPSPQHSFVEFGAGKGRVVVVVAGLPFGSVIGVELSSSLAGVARANIDRNRRRAVSRDVRIVEADMGTYPIPDDLAVAYFYNPSRGPAFRQAIEAIRVSLERRPRRFRLIYGNPVMHHEVVAAGFRFVHAPRFLNWNVYEYRGSVRAAGC